MPTGLYLCLYQTKYFKPHTQEFGLEIHSGAVTRKQPQQRLLLSHVIHLPVVTNASTKHYQNMSKSIKVRECKDFGFRGDKYITKKKMRVFYLASNTPISPLLHFYQILSYLKQYGSYGLHKSLASGELTT